MNSQFAINVQQIKQGLRICVTCGLPSIPADSSSLRIRCVECYKDWRAAPNDPKTQVKFCKLCGDPATFDLWCEACAKGTGEKVKIAGKEPCKECGVRHPSHYHSPSLA